MRALTVVKLPIPIERGPDRGGIGEGPALERLRPRSATEAFDLALGLEMGGSPMVDGDPMP